MTTPNETLTALMSTTPNTLAKAQRDALKAHVLGVLQHYIAAVQTNQFDIAKLPTFFCPAENDSGRDSRCIDFGYSAAVELDVQEVFEKLRVLHDLATRGPL